MLKMCSQVSNKDGAGHGLEIPALEKYTMMPVNGSTDKSVFLRNT